MGVQSNESLLKIKDLCFDMAEEGHAFEQIDAAVLSSERPHKKKHERPKNEGEGVSETEGLERCRVWLHYNCTYFDL